MRARVSAKKPAGPASGPDNSGSGLSSSRVQSVDRAVSLLRAVADAGSDGAATVALGDACGLNRATAWRILTTLEAHGLVVSDRASGHWTPRSRAGGHRAVGRLRRGAARRARGPRAAGPADRRDRGARGPAPRRADLRRRGGAVRDRVGQLVRATGQPARHLDGQGAAGLVHRGGAGPPDAAAAQALHRHDDHRPRERCAPTSTAAASAGTPPATGSSTRPPGACRPRCSTAPAGCSRSSASGVRRRGSPRSASRPWARSPSRPRTEMAAPLTRGSRQSSSRVASSGPGAGSSRCPRRGRRRPGGSRR